MPCTVAELGNYLNEILRRIAEFCGYVLRVHTHQRVIEICREKLSAFGE